MPLHLKDQIYATVNSDAAYNGTYKLTFPNKAGTIALTSDIPSIPIVNNGQLTIQKNGTNVQTFTANQSGNVTANITVPTKTSDLTNDSDFVEDASYVHTDNNYTTTDKNKLAGIAAGAEVNVQANWAQTTTTADDYIKNKPTIPTVNNATLTIQKNGSTVKTFTANASSNVTANITVPTALSDLSGTVSSSQIADGAVTSDKIDWSSLGHHHATSSTQTAVNTSATTLLSFQLTAGTWLLIGTSDFNHANTATGDAFIGFQNLTANTEIGNRFYFNELNNGTYWSVETAHEVVALTGTANIGFIAKKGQGTLYSTRKSFTAIRIG